MKLYSLFRPFLTSTIGGLVIGTSLYLEDTLNQETLFYIATIFTSTCIDDFRQCGNTVTICHRLVWQTL